MKEFLTFSDLELELLSKLNVEFRGNCFVNILTGHEFTFKKTNYGIIKSFGNNEKYQSYEFKGKDGKIVFVRSTKPLEDYIPSIMVDINGASFAIGESYNNDPYRIIDDSNDAVTEIKKNLKNILFQYRNKDRHYYAIKIIPECMYFLSRTYFMEQTKTVAVIKREFCTLSRDAMNKELNVERTDSRYEDLFEDTVDKIYDKEEDRDVIKKLSTIFTRVNLATLYLPSIRKVIMQIDLQNEESHVKHVHDMSIKEIEERYEKDVADINRRREEIEKLAAAYPVEKEETKKK